MDDRIEQATSRVYRAVAQTWPVSERMRAAGRALAESERFLKLAGAELLINDPLTGELWVKQAARRAACAFDLLATLSDEMEIAREQRE